VFVRERDLLLLEVIGPKPVVMERRSSQRLSSVVFSRVHRFGVRGLRLPGAYREHTVSLAFAARPLDGASRELCDDLLAMRRRRADFRPLGEPAMKVDFAFVTAAVVVLASPAAGAQEAAPDAPRQEYPTPLSQLTQPTYVPQSVAMSGPRLIDDWREGEPVPPGYHTASRIRKGPVIIGSIVFGIFYLVSTEVGAGASGLNGHTIAPALWIPCVGPFIQMAWTTSALGNWALAWDGLVQSGGLALLIYGIASPSTVLVRNDLGLRVLPEASPGGGGLRLVAPF
jgi:hypothetical protein